MRLRLRTWIGSSRIPFLGTLGLAAVLRFAYVLSARSVDPATLVYDAANYDEAALRLLASRYFAYGSGPIAAHPNAYTVPGYSLFLAGIYRVFGTDSGRLFRVYLAQAALGVVAVALVYLVSSRLGGRAAGVFSAVLAAVYAPAIFAETEILTESLYAPLLAGLLYVCILALDRPSVGMFALVGVVAGVGAYVRPVGVVLVALPLFVLVAAGRVPWLSALRLACVATVAAALILAPWWIRNYRVYHRPVVFMTATAHPAFVATFGGEIGDPIPGYAVVWPTSTTSDDLALNERLRGEARARSQAQWHSDPARYLGQRIRMIWFAVAMPHEMLWFDLPTMTAFQIWFNRAVRALHFAILMLAGGAVLLRRHDERVKLVALGLLCLFLVYGWILPLPRYAFPSMVVATSLAGTALATITGCPSVGCRLRSLGLSGVGGQQ
jgi:4-amino-4-deoxy-L-arabinose transferase-like glycosyltransferase